MTRHAVQRTPRPPPQPNGEPSLWQTCAAVLDLVAPTADVIAVTPVGSYLAWRLRAAVAPERLFLHAPQPAPQGIRHPGEAEPVILPGEHEHDRPSLPRGLWPHPPVAVPARVRPLDLLYADSHNVGLLILDAGVRAPGILRGVARILAAHAPLLLIDCAAAALAERPGLWKACLGATPGYTWNDDPCRGVALGVRASPLPVARDPGLVATRWRERLRRMTADQIPNVSLEFNDALSVTGMYPAERDSSGGWRRCTGPGSHASFYLSLPAPGLWHLRFQVAHWGTVGSPAELRLYADGVRLHHDRVDPHGIEFVPFDAPRHHSGAVLIELITPVAAAGSAGLALTHCLAESAEP